MHFKDNLIELTSHQMYEMSCNCGRIYLFTWMSFDCKVAAVLRRPQDDSCLRPVLF